MGRGGGGSNFFSHLQMDPPDRFCNLESPPDPYPELWVGDKTEFCDMPFEFVFRLSICDETTRENHGFSTCFSLARGVDFIL